MDHVSSFIKKKRTTATDAVVKAINKIGTSVSSESLGFLEAPLSWDDGRSLYTGFWRDVLNGSSLELLNKLRQVGFSTRKYKAPDEWKVSSIDGVLEVAYFEGDLYAKVM